MLLLLLLQLLLLVAVEVFIVLVVAKLAEADGVVVGARLRFWLVV